MSPPELPPVSPSAELDASLDEWVRDWIRDIVIGLDLCPFAHRSVEAGALHTVLAPGDLESVLTCVAAELAHVAGQDATTGATTVILVCAPDGSASIAERFDDYLDLVAMAEDLSESLGYAGRVQIASFHPDYVFADAPPDDPANWSNRSPVPLLHLLLEDAVSAAVAHHPDAEGIPERNIETLRTLGEAEIRRRQPTRVR